CRPGNSCSPHHHMFSVGVSARADSEGARLLSAAPAPRLADLSRNFRREKPFEPFRFIVIFVPPCWFLWPSYHRILVRAHQPAIDDEQLAGHIAAIARCEKDDRARNIF